MTFTTKFFIFPLIIATLAGCSSTKKKSSMDDMGSMETTGDTLRGDSDSGTAEGLQTVYFAFNSSSLSDSTKDALMQNADILKEKSNLIIEIEGHADERGGREYNLALGENRANETKNYLVSLGVPAERMTTISYGKERPIAFGHEEGSWSKNRRSNFVITSR